MVVYLGLVSSRLCTPKPCCSVSHGTVKRNDGMQLAPISMKMSMSVHPYKWLFQGGGGLCLWSLGVLVSLSCA